MHKERRITCLTILFVIFTLGFVLSTKLGAHCDGLDGPVVKAAQKALETRDVNAVLIWVQKDDEDAVRKAYSKTLAVRTLSPEAANLADTYFFETVVRLHRAGEGAPYTGLKPAGRDLGPAIPAADIALESGSADALLKLLADAVRSGTQQHFKDANAKKNFSRGELEAGRAYVKAYVQYLHYVERLYEAAQNPIHGHTIESGEGASHADEH